MQTHMRVEKWINGNAELSVMLMLLGAHVRAQRENGTSSIVASTLHTEVFSAAVDGRRLLAERLVGRQLV